MKLVSIFITISLVTILSCLPFYGASCHQKQPVPTITKPSPEPSPNQKSWNENQRPLNVLILTIPASGHTSVPLALGEELARRGHYVAFSTSGNSSQAAVEKVGVIFKSSGPKNDFVQLVRQQKSLRMGDMIEKLPLLRGVIEQETNQFINMIKEDLKTGVKWDVILTSDFLMSLLPCLSAHLQIPAILIGTSSQVAPHTYPPWPWASHLVGGVNDDMTFTDRLINAIERVALPPFLAFMFYLPARSAISALCPALTTPELLNAPAVYLPHIVPTVIGFEYPRTMTPLTHYVGPVQSELPAPLSPELEAWLASKEDKSVLYISMGSLLSVSEDMANALVDGISRTNYSVVWAMRKSSEFELSVDPERFYVSKWLPQLAILRHRATGLAILHGGANGVHESLHSGVPPIVLPAMTEQKSNAGRVHHHRLGIHLEKDGLTADQIYESIVEIDSGDYRENVAKLQRMFQQAGGAKRAADLVEFYSEIGYDHLIPAYAKYHWSWVQYYNVDVYALLLACALITIYIDYRILKCVYSRCCHFKKHKTE